MDDIATYNQNRWRALAQANALFTRPYLDLSETTARERLDSEGLLGDLRGKAVLCLAGGGGQQSAAFALLGARVTVFDLSPEQLARDQQAAAHYGYTITTQPGDMRDLSVLPSAAYDVVWHPYSLNFVPEARAVFRQVARVIRPGGLYYFNCANPLTLGLDRTDWTGAGYLLKYPYLDGAEVAHPDQDWVHAAEASVAPPREFRHTLGTLLNGLLEAGFTLRRFSDTQDFYPDPAATPGSDEHFAAYAPWWLAFWSVRDA